MRVLSAVFSFLAVPITVGGTVRVLVDEPRPAEADIGSSQTYMDEPYVARNRTLGKSSFRQQVG